MVKTEREIKSIVSEYVKRLREAGIEVDAIVMYGSYARSGPHAESDLDLAVISSSFANLDVIERQILLSRANCWGLNVAIEPLGYTPQEISTVQKGTLLDEIVRTGKTVFRVKSKKVKIA